MRIFVASDNETINFELLEFLLAQGHECQVSDLTPMDLTLSRFTQAGADILVVVLSPDPEPGLAFLHEVPKKEVQRVLAVGPMEPRVRLQALQEGSDLYFDQLHVRAEMEVILGHLVSRRAAAPSQALQGQVISVLGSSGGIGSSTIAVNVATALAKEHQKCILIDLKLGSGDLSSLLDLKPTHTLADLCQNTTRVDRAIFERSLVNHACGVQLLAPPRSFADIGHVTTQGVRDILTMARATTRFVVVDLDDAFHAEQALTLRQSDVILLVLRLDFTCLRNTRRTLDHFDQLKINRGRVRLVVNRYGEARQLPPAKAEEVLGMKITHYVPDEPKTINWANNNGTPAILEVPSAKVSKSFMQIAASLNSKVTV